MESSLRSMLAHVVDYAGLFPPATLGMGEATENFARYAAGDFAWMLGRFICPASRLGEFTEHAAIVLPGTHATSGYREFAARVDPWKISVVIDGPMREALDDAINHIWEFNEHHSQEQNGLCRADSIELKISSPQDVDWALDLIPDDLLPFFEFPVDRDVRGFVTALAGNEESGGAAAKIRCGGVTAEAFPTSEQVADFLVACAAGGVPFKATAGLHHPVRAEHPLTYEPNPPRGVMHGFLNLLVAAGVAKDRRADRRILVRILEETDPTAFVAERGSVGWKDQRIAGERLESIRRGFAISFGSCSFEEPVRDLSQLRWL